MGAVEAVGTVETLFESYPFAKECILVFLSVILGGICTAAINNGAMRKKCRFDMQYEILKEESKKIAEFKKALEGLEINFSFLSRNTDDLQNDIQSVASMALKTNERLREKRKFVRKYLSATIVEESAQIVADYHKTMFCHGNDGIMDFQVIDKVDDNTLQGLRRLTVEVKKLHTELTESLEKLIAPSLFAKIKRKCRNPFMLFEDCHAIWAVHRKHDKKK